MAGKAQINTASNLELTAMRRVLNILQKLSTSQQRTRVAQWILEAAEELNEKLDGPVDGTQNQDHGEASLGN